MTPQETIDALNVIFRKLDIVNRDFDTCFSSLSNRLDEIVCMLGDLCYEMEEEVE